MSRLSIECHPKDIRTIPAIPCPDAVFGICHKFSYVILAELEHRSFVQVRTPKGSFTVS